MSKYVKTLKSGLLSKRAAIVFGLTALSVSGSALAQLDDGSGIVAGLTTLAGIAASIVAALIVFGISWYLGKKVYAMTKV